MIASHEYNEKQTDGIDFVGLFGFLEPLSLFRKARSETGGKVHIGKIKKVWEILAYRQPSVIFTC